MSGSVIEIRYFTGNENQPISCIHLEMTERKARNFFEELLPGRAYTVVDVPRQLSGALMCGLDVLSPNSVDKSLQALKPLI